MTVSHKTLLYSKKLDFLGDFANRATLFTLNIGVESGLEFDFILF